MWSNHSKPVFVVLLGIGLLSGTVFARTLTVPERVFGSGQVYRVAYSPDGTQFLSVAGGITHIYGVQTGTQIIQFGWGSLSAAFSPDGTQVVTGSIDGTATIWDAAAGVEILRLVGHGGLVYSAVFSPDGTKIVTGSSDTTAKLWDATTGEELRTFSGHTGSILSVAFSPDASKIVSGSDDYTARVWVVATGAMERILEGHTGNVSSVAFSPEGAQVLTGSWDYTAKLWDVTTGTELQTFTGHMNRVNSAVFSPDGTNIYTASTDDTAKLWSISTGTELRTFAGHTETVNDVSVSPDGTRLLSASEDTFVKLWDVSTGEELGDFGGDSAGRLFGLALSSDGRRIVTGAGDNRGLLWNVETGEELVSYVGHTNGLRAAAISPDGSMVLTASADRTAKLWDADTGVELRTFSGHTGGLNTCAFSPDGNKVLTGSADTTCRLWDITTGAVLVNLVGHTAGVRSVAFSPDGTKVISGSRDATIKVWDATTGALLRTIAHGDEVWGVAFSPDEAEVLSGGNDRTAKLWDAATGSEIRSFVGHGAALRSVAFSQDGKNILTGSLDGIAKLWDVSTGAERLTILGHMDSIEFSFFFPDGQRAITGSWDGTVRLWKFPAPGHEITQAPPRYISAYGGGTGTVPISGVALHSGDFITVKGGLSPVYKQLSPGETDFTIDVPLIPEAVNNLQVSVVWPDGEEGMPTVHRVVEGAAFPSTSEIVTALHVSPESVEVPLQGSQAFSAAATFSDGSAADVTPFVFWSMTNREQISQAGMYINSKSGTALVRAYDNPGIYSNYATVTDGAKILLPDAKTLQGTVFGTVRDNYTGNLLSSSDAKITAYAPRLLNILKQTPAPGNYSFLIEEGFYDLEGRCPGYRAEITYGGTLLSPRTEIEPGVWADAVYSNHVLATRALEQNYSLRPNDSSAPLVTFIEPVDGMTVNAATVGVTAIVDDQVSLLASATLTINGQSHNILADISSTGFYRREWPLPSGGNVLRLRAVDSEGNANEAAVTIIYAPGQSIGTDADADGMGDTWEATHGLNLASDDSWDDLDGDGLHNIEEWRFGTAPERSDSDNDGLTDYHEHAVTGSDPLASDTDGDGVTDGAEVAQGSDPARSDLIHAAVVWPVQGTLLDGNRVTVLAEPQGGASATDIASIEFFAMGPGTDNEWLSLGQSTQAPFAISWNADALLDGGYALRAVATSKRGFVDDEAPFTVVIVATGAPLQESGTGSAHTLRAPVLAGSSNTVACTNGNDTVVVTIPAGALPAADTLVISFPVGQAPSLSPREVDAGRYVSLHLESGLTTFLGGRKVSIAMRYPDANADGFVDGLDYNAELLSVRYLATPTGAFAPLVSSSVDTRLCTVTGVTNHFSAFGLVFEVPAAPLQIDTASLPNGKEGTAYSVALDASGGVPPYTWSVASGTLPADVSIAGEALHGTPSESGSSAFTLRVTDSQTPPYTAQKAYTVTMAAANQPDVSITRAAGQDAMANTLPIAFDITFSEAVAGFEISDVTFVGTAQGITANVTGSGVAYTLTVTACGEGTLVPSIAEGAATADSSSAPNVASAGAEEVWYDAIAPTVTVQPAPGQALTTYTLPVSFAITFSEAVEGFTLGDVDLGGTATGQVATLEGSGAEYTLWITSASGYGTFLPSIEADAAQDAYGNLNIASTSAAGAVTYEHLIRPTVTVEQAAGQADPARTLPIRFAVKFSSAVTGFDMADVQRGGTATGVQYTVTGSGTDYTIQVNTVTGDGSIFFTVPENVAGSNLASTSLDNRVAYDTTPPTLSLTGPFPAKTSAGPADYVASYANASVLSLDPSDITLLRGGTADATVSVVPMDTRTMRIELSGITGIGSLGIQIAPGTATDPAGNTASGAASAASVQVVLPDSDEDGIPDRDEPTSDFDGDGLPCYIDADSDGDGADDGMEVFWGYNPHDANEFPVLPMGAVALGAGALLLIAGMRRLKRQRQAE